MAELPKEIVVVTDIHGQWNNLERCLPHFPAGAPIWCLGDTVEWAEEGDVKSLKWALENAQILLRGNHDEDILDQTILEGRMHRGWIAPPFGMWHASPRHPTTEWVQDLETVQECIAYVKAQYPVVKIILSGHTHRTRVFKHSKLILEAPDDGQKLALPIDSDDTYYITLGAAGVPNRDRGPEWMVLRPNLETKSVMVEFRQAP